MLKYALALALLCNIPAAAIEACSILNPIEIAATLRRPGVVVAFHAKSDRDHYHTCILARISSAGSFDENLTRFKSEAPPTLMIALADDLGAKGFDLLKPAPDVTITEAAGIGDRAVLRRGAKEVNLFVASGTNFLRLGFAGEAPTGKQEQDLTVLAREALATNFDGARVTKYDVAERALNNDKAAFEADPKNFAIFLAAMKKFDEARSYNLQALAANPYDADTFYIAGILDWITTDQSRMVIRERPDSPAQPLTGPECADVRNTNREKVEQGIASLSKAVKLRPDFSDAMAYLNVLYLQRAEYECDDAAARATDLKTAREWGAKAAVAKKAAEGKAVGGNVLPLFPAASPSGTMGVLAGVPGGIPGGQMGGVIGGIISSTPGPVSKGGIPERVTASAVVSAGLLVKNVRPEYPPLARQARIQGTVVLRAVIGKDGSIENLTLVSGHPMLVPPAIDAVKQWKYKPYLLNGQAVEVDTQIQVTFTLSGG